jgi:hypothetical protein
MKLRTIKQIKKNCEKLYKQFVGIRDEHTCQWCGKDLRNEAEHVHHIIPRSRSAYLFYDLLNLILLCRGCHHHYHTDTEAGVRWFETEFKVRWEYLHAPTLNEKHLYQPRRYIVKSSWHKSDYEKIEIMLKEKLADLEG